METLLPGIAAAQVPTGRLTTAVLSVPDRTGAGDRTDASALSPRQVLLAHYVKPPHVPEHLESMLSTRLGDDHYPGTARTTPAWPGIAQQFRAALTRHLSGGQV
jgi:hypothetical protein